MKLTTMATIYIFIKLIVLMSMTSSYAVPECSQDRYLPDLDSQYNNDHIVFAMDGESVTISCTIICPSSIENLNNCSDNIRQDWMIIDPSEDKVYQMNAATSRNKFIRRFKIDGEAINFSGINFELCSVNGTDRFEFNLTLHNFTSSLVGLIVVCGLRRYGHIRADYHLIKEYARLREINTATPPTTTSTTTTICQFTTATDHEPTTTTATTDTISSTTVSTDTIFTRLSSTPAVPEVQSRSSWPDEASFPVMAALSAVCIFLILLTVALIVCNVKLQRQLRETERQSRSTMIDKNTLHTHMYPLSHYDAFPKHPWQTAVVLDNKCNADLW